MDQPVNSDSDLFLPSPHGDAESVLFIARLRLADQRDLNDSLITINAEVEQRCEKLEALLVELYNATEFSEDTGITYRMRDLGLLDEDAG